MKYVHLGRTGLKVSRICLGTMNFGPQADEAESHRIMDRALEVGVQFFDTADIYGWRKGEGITEQIIGRWFAQGGGRRERVVLATKVYGDMGDGPNDARLSALHIRKACDASLRRLRTDYIDVYQMHHVDLETPWEEVWGALELLRQQGKILYAGSSNFAGWHLATAQAVARQRGGLGLASEQCVYNLRQRMVELEVLPACRANGIGVLPWSPLSGGLLGGCLGRPAEGRRAEEWFRQRVERHRTQIEAYERFCEELGERPATIALAWLLHRPEVTAPVVGPRTPFHLDEALRALDVKLDRAQMQRLDEIWPGPGGEAPAAYTR